VFFHCVKALVFSCESLSLFRCARLFFLAPRVARRLGAGSPPLAARQGSCGLDPAVRPGQGPLGVRKKPRPRHPSPNPHAGSPGPPEGSPLHPRGARKTPHPERPGTYGTSRDAGKAKEPQQRLGERGCGGKPAPRATGAIAPECAGPKRPDRRVETLAPTQGLLRGRGTARVRTLVCASLVARGGGSEGWARGPARATAPGSRGKREKLSRSEKKKSHRGTDKKKSRYAVSNRNPSARPREKEEGLRSRSQEHPFDRVARDR
jgi:hypothetical protein